MSLLHVGTAIVMPQQPNQFFLPATGLWIHSTLQHCRFRREDILASSPRPSNHSRDALQGRDSVIAVFKCTSLSTYYSTLWSLFSMF